MDQNQQATYQVGVMLSTLTLAFKYTLDRYAKEAGYEKIDEVAEVLRSSIRNAEPTPNVPDAVYTVSVQSALAAIEEMIKEVRRTVRPT